MRGERKAAAAAVVASGGKAWSGSRAASSASSGSVCNESAKEISNLKSNIQHQKNVIAGLQIRLKNLELKGASSHESPLALASEDLSTESDKSDSTESAEDQGGGGGGDSA